MNFNSNLESNRPVTPAEVINETDSEMFDAEGKPRFRVTLLDGSIASLSRSEIIEANTAIMENFKESN